MLRFACTHLKSTRTQNGNILYKTSLDEAPSLIQKNNFLVKKHLLSFFLGPLIYYRLFFSCSTSTFHIWCIHLSCYVNLSFWSCIQFVFFSSLKWQSPKSNKIKPITGHKQGGFSVPNMIFLNVQLTHRSCSAKSNKSQTLRSACDRKTRCKAITLGCFSSRRS